MQTLLPTVVLAAVASASPPLWGVSFHLPLAPGEASQLGAAFSIARTDLKWEDVEKERGVYNFSVYKNLAEELAGASVTPLFILDYGNPLYTAPHNIPSTAEAISAYANYAVAAMRALSKYDPYFELWNEPNNPSFGYKPGHTADLWTAMAKGVQHAISREGLSSQRIVGPALIMIGPDRGFLKKVCKSGGFTGFGAVSIHPYAVTPGTPEDRVSHFEAIKQDMKDCGGPAELWSSEWGYSTCTFPCFEGPIPALHFYAYANPHDQASYLARMWLSDASAGIRTSIWYDYREGSGRASDEESHFGVVEASYLNASVAHQPKQSYIAAHTLQQMFGRGKWTATGLVAAVSGPKDLQIAAFERVADGIQGYAVWRACKGTCPVQSATFSASGCFEVTSMLGKSLPRICASAGGFATLEVFEEPQYLISVTSEQKEVFL